MTQENLQSMYTIQATTVQQRVVERLQLAEWKRIAVNKNESIRLQREGRCVDVDALGRLTFKDKSS